MVQDTLSRMRRALASLLLAVFSFPLIAPAMLAQAASDLPTCCSRKGKHHCGMAEGEASGRAPAGAALKVVQPKCPFYNKTGAVPAYSKIALLRAVPQAGAPNLLRLTISRPDDNRPRIISRSSVRKRGPPVFPN